MTTIVLVRKNNEVVVAGDGQVSMGNTVVKSTASKVRKIEKRDVVAGFAGSTADALTLFERLALENRKACLMSNHGQVAYGDNLNSAFELAEEVENICHQYINAIKLGEPKILSSSEMDVILEKVKNYKKG